MVSCDWIRFLLCIVLFVNQIWFGYFWVLVVVIYFIELIGQFFIIASGSVIPTLVEKDDLVKANSYFSITDNLTGLFGYAIGGVLIGLMGFNTLTAVNAASFLISGLLLLMIAVDKEEQTKHRQTPNRSKNVFPRIL